jgi:ribosomal protein S18 acetylase RimI-like enzyme
MVEDVAEILIRPASVEDAERIAAVHIASWREAYADVVPQDYLDSLDLASRTERWREVFSNLDRGTSVWVAEEEGEVLGFASLGPSRDEDADRTTMEIYTIYLEPSAWGRGVARELMRTVLAALPAGAAVTLWVLAANERAQLFYRRNGFTADGVERMEEIGGQPFREVRYRRG